MRVKLFQIRPILDNELKKIIFFSTTSHLNGGLQCNTNTTSKSEIIKPYGMAIEGSSNKISIVGLGSVGKAITAMLLLKKLTNYIAIVDVSPDQRELSDFNESSIYFDNARVEGGDDYQITASSRICIVTAGIRPRESGDRIAIVADNVSVLKTIIPPLVQYSPDAIILLVSNPVDVLTYAAVKFSGFPKHKIIGSGTNLDTARFRYYMAQKFGVCPSDCKGWIIGEHGNLSVPVWSSCTIGGAYIKDMNSEMGNIDRDPENFDRIHKDVVAGGKLVHGYKGYTNWAVALSVVDLVNAIIKNNKSIRAVTVCAKGFFGIDQDVYLSLPAVLGQNGISDVIKLNLTNDERNKLKKAADYLYSIQQQINL